MPVTRYEEAIAAARKSARSRGEPAEAPEVADEPADEASNEPLPATDDRPSQSRAKTLGNLTAAMASALAEGDMEAVAVTHHAIGRLVPVKLVG